MRCKAREFRGGCLPGVRCTDEKRAATEQIVFFNRLLPEQEGATALVQPRDSGVLGGL